MKVCLNGAIMDAAQARIDPADRGFTLGDGIFETIAVKNGAPKRIGAHLARLRQGAAALGIPVPYGDLDLGGLMAETLIANTMTDAVLRVTLSRGTGARGVAPPPDAKPTLLITAAPLPPQPAPANVIVAETTRRNEYSPLSRLKTLNYLDNVMARQEAAAKGADDALLLNTAGRVAESTVANVFVLLNGGLVTPPVSEGALPGTVRADLIARFRAEEKPLTLEDLAQASEIFLSNALGLRPVIAVNGRAVGDGETGLVTAMLAIRI